MAEDKRPPCELCGDEYYCGDRGPCSMNDPIPCNDPDNFEGAYIFAIIGFLIVCGGLAGILSLLGIH